MEPRALRALIIDDDEVQLEMVSRRLGLDGFVVATTTSSFGASNLIRSFSPDVVLVDVNIPALRGDTLLALARRFAPSSTRFVLYSACDESQLRRLAQESAADGWISKSMEMDAVISRLKQICKA